MPAKSRPAPRRHHAGKSPAKAKPARGPKPRQSGASDGKPAMPRHAFREPHAHETCIRFSMRSRSAGGRWVRRLAKVSAAPARQMASPRPGSGTFMANTREGSATGSSNALCSPMSAQSQRTPDGVGQRECRNPEAARPFVTVHATQLDHVPLPFSAAATSARKSSASGEALRSDPGLDGPMAEV